MKKLILSIAALVAFTFSGYSQCTPDPQFTIGGIYPDSASNLPTAYVGAAYDEVITVVVPVDTVVDVPFLGLTLVDFADITLDNVSGLPANFAYSCNPGNCVFPGNSSGCVNLYSTVNPTASDIGVYPLSIEVTATVIIPLVGNQSQASTIDYYYIEIVDQGGVGIGTYNSESFELKTIFPNPVVDNSRIQFISGKTQSATFTIMNVLGKTLLSNTIAARKGVNEVFVSATDFPNGIYLYSITANGKTSTKRMIIRK
jgi:hypothetical protein